MLENILKYIGMNNEGNQLKYYECDAEKKEKVYGCARLRLTRPIFKLKIN